jgi:hypothetical protein
LGSTLLSTVATLILVPAQAVFSQVQTTPQTSEGEEIHDLRERIAAQDEQLAAQQSQINALQTGLADQKALIDRLLHSDDIAYGNHPPDEAAALLSEQSSALRHRPYGTAVVAQPAALEQSVVQSPAQSAALKNEQKEQPYAKEPRKWFDKYSIRGYMQFRADNVVNTNPKYVCDQCDKGIGPDNKFFLRRMRLVISGNVSDRISIYLQPDFANSSGSTQNYAQLRDAYFDTALDSQKAHRFRVGLSKIPYGFENMQSSQNRLDFDRDDAINSCCQNERDIGIFYYWAPPYIRERFAQLVGSGLKGSGDYGELGVGLYNGEGLNQPSQNDSFHYVARYTYPFKLRNGQFIETSIQGYSGNYTVTSLSSSTITKPDAEYDDRRIALSLIVYPQPFGLQTEYNWGTGPEYNPQTKYIDQKALDGGYLQVSYRATRLPYGMIFQPYSRFTYYNGGKKFELDARKYLVVEGDFGIEMQFGPHLEFTPQYQYGDREFEDGGKPVNRQLGSLLRFQLQYNY